MIIAGLIFTIAVFLWYVLMVVKRWGVQPSISSSYLLFKQSQEAYYTLFMWGISIPIILITDNALGMIAGSLLCFDGAARTGSGDKLTQFIHNFGADAGIAVGMLMLWLNFHQWYLVVPMLLATGFILWKNKNTAWWIEVAAFVTVIIGLFINKVMI